MKKTLTTLMLLICGIVLSWADGPFRTARYDGKVLDASAFIAVGINGAAPADATVTFAQDTANA